MEFRSCVVSGLKGESKTKKENLCGFVHCIFPFSSPPLLYACFFFISISSSYSHPQLEWVESVRERRSYLRTTPLLCVLYIHTYSSEAKVPTVVGWSPINCPIQFQLLLNST